MERTKIRIRSQRKKTNVSTLESKRSISCHQMQKDNPNSFGFLDEVKKIMDTARETSTTLNLQFRKYSDKPEMQMVYVDPKKMQKKLQEMEARIDVNKYQMLVQVRKDPISNFSAQKKTAKEEPAEANYKSLYKQYLIEEEKYGEPPQIINNPIISLYQFYDDQQKDWKESLKNRCLISRQVKKQTKLGLHAFNINKVKQEDESLSQSQNISKNLEKDQKYQQMFQEFAERNKSYQNEPQVPKAEKIILDRFQTKFYRCRERKFEHLFDRLNGKQSEEEDRNPETQKKKKSIKLTVPQTCKKVYNTQNKLLEENLNNGLSRHHTKKLIIQFNKTILDMKATQSKSQVLAKGNIFKKTADRFQTNTKNN